jgi:hypothetical protein
MHATIGGWPPHLGRIAGPGRMAPLGEPDGVKPEEQVLVTEREAVPFSRSPLIDTLQT